LWRSTYLSSGGGQPADGSGSTDPEPTPGGTTTPPTTASPPATQPPTTQPPTTQPPTTQPPADDPTLLDSVTGVRGGVVDLLL
jgi:hypothetical protein